jgi:hypothetical protein
MSMTRVVFALTTAMSGAGSVIPFRAMAAREQIKRESEHIPIKRERGVLGRAPGEKPFRQWWADYKRKEKALEESKYKRLRPR